jgi:hypothetical protein
MGEGERKISRREFSAKDKNRLNTESCRDSTRMAAGVNLRYEIKKIFGPVRAGLICQGVFSKSACCRKRLHGMATAFGLRWQSQRRQRFRRVNQGAIFFQSGVALRLPPQSKISHFENTL